MKSRFLADANFNQKIVAGLLLREPQIDFEWPQDVIPEGMKDPQVLELGAMLGRIIVTHDVRTMPSHFGVFIADKTCSGLIWHVSEADEWINRMRRLPL